MVTAIYIAAAAIALFLWCWRKKYSFWRDQNVPHLKAWPLLGSYSLGKKPLHELEQELYNTYGRVYGRYDGSVEVLSVGDPELLKSVLIKDFHLFPNRRDVRFNDTVFDNTLFALEGENWKRVRNVVTRALTSAKLKRMLPLMEDCCQILTENILSISREKKQVCLQRIFGAFTIDVIGRCAFGIAIDSLSSEEDPFVEKAKRLLDSKLGFRTVMTMLCPSVMRCLRISLLNPETTAFYRRVILDVVEERKKKRNREDFLQLLLDAEFDVQDQNNNDVISDEKITSQYSESENEKVKGATVPTGLSHDELVAQCVTFFMAGYEATTTLLTNAMFQLAVHQHYQERAVEEIEMALRNNKGELNYDTLGELKFMDAILNECSRLCPAMARNERRAERNCTLRGTDIRLKKGSIISIPIYAMHRDPEWFPDPDTFRPERFLEPETCHSPLSHLPFGAGPRVCIGFRFVMMQVKLCLARTLLRFKVVPADDTPNHLNVTEMRNILKLENVDVCFQDRTTS